jgi:hypothetical protein
LSVAEELLADCPDSDKVYLVPEFWTTDALHIYIYTQYIWHFTFSISGRIFQIWECMPLMWMRLMKYVSLFLPMHLPQETA